MSDGPIVIGMRHGEVHNPEGVIYAGLAGYGLSDYGRSQASQVAEALREAPLIALYASPLDRAMETAHAIAEATGVEIIPDERLHEWRHWQQWAGMTWQDLFDKERETWEAYHTDPGGVTTGESLAELADRMESWLDHVRARHSEGVVVGVSHLEPLRAILLRLGDRPPTDLFEIKVELAETVRLWPDPDPSVRPVAELLPAP